MEKDSIDKKLNTESNTIQTPKSKSVKKNYVYNVIYQLFLIIVPLIVTPYISRVLTPNGVGQYSFSYSLITYFTIFGALGFGYYGQREIAKYQDDKLNQSKIFWEVILCRLIPVSIALIINIVLCCLNVYGNYNLLMWIFSINIVALAFDIAFFFQGNEQFGKLVFRNVIIKTLSIITIFVFVKKESDLWLYALINSIMLIVSNLSLWLYLPKVLCKPMEKINPLRHLKGTIILFIPTIATSIYTVLDKTLIGILVPGTYTVIEDGIEVIKKYSDLENGYYEQTEKLVKMAMTIITCIGTVMIPRNSNEISKGNYEQVKKNINISSRLVLLIGLPMVMGLIAVASNIVPWFFGNGYEKCINLFWILSPLIVIIGFSNVFGLQYLVPSGQDKKFTIALATGSIVNILLNLIFIKTWYSIGAAIATIVAECCVTIMMAIMVRKEVNILKVFLKSWKVIFASIIMFVFTFIISQYLISSIINSFIIALIGILIYGVLLVILREEFVIRVLKKIILIFIHNKRTKNSKN